MDYEAVRAGLQAAIPFNNHIGLEVVEVAEGRGVVRLPEGNHLRNHVGSQHAGALFSAAEAASGGAVVGAFAEQLGTVTPLAKSARIDYVKIAKGPITATATVDGDPAELLGRIEAEGRVEFPVTVKLADESGTEVARVTVDWHLRQNA